MRLILSLLLALSMALPGLLHAQEQKITKSEEIQIPKGHEAFFDEVFTLMKKYPESAKRFGLTDRSTKASSQTFKPIFNPRTGCCGDWVCSGGHECGCTDWCLK